MEVERHYELLLHYWPILLKVYIDNGTLEDYPGPASKVDLILLANILSFFPKTADRQIQRCLQWLNPGGHVVIILNTMNPILEATGK